VKLLKRLSEHPCRKDDLIDLIVLEEAKENARLRLKTLRYKVFRGNSPR